MLICQLAKETGNVEAMENGRSCVRIPAEYRTDLGEEAAREDDAKTACESDCPANQLNNYGLREYKKGPTPHVSDCYFVHELYVVFTPEHIDVYFGI